MSSFLNLGKTQVSNWLVSQDNLGRREKKYPLHTLVCNNCGFVQVSKKISSKKLFPKDYLYLSSYSTSWLTHCNQFTNEIIEELDLNSSDLVMEIASNDGYLLQYFKQQGVGVLGIEPTELAANIAILDKGIETRKDFFGANFALKLKSEGVLPSLIIANNVLAHVPDINDFIKGISILIENQGVATIEFPHLFNLIRENQFDTIYHEHYSYLNLTSLSVLFERNDLQIFDAKEIDTHGGSLRIYVCSNHSNRMRSLNVDRLIRQESKLDPRNKNVQSALRKKTNNVKIELIKELKRLKSEDKVVVAYGAAAKGNTLLNFAGIDRKLIAYVVDKNPSKQKKFLPGSKIEVFPESELLKRVPDVVLILPWNLAAEISSQLSYLEEFDTKFFRAIPEVQYL